MEALIDEYIVRTEHESKKEKDLGNGQKIIIPGDWNPYEEDNYSHEGVVLSVPKGASDGKLHPIEVGDTVYFLYTIVDNKLEGDKYRCDKNEIFAYKRDGKLYMVDGWNFIQPIEESEDQTMVNGIYIKSTPDKVERMGRVYACDEWMQEQEVRVGDIVMFRPDREYPMYVEGELVYRIRTIDIYGVVYEEEEAGIQ